MPAYGMPPNLQLILESLFGKCRLRSWQVESDRHGCAIRIRFGTVETENDGGCMDNLTGSFVRKSPSQIKRDKTRSVQQFAMKQMTRSEAKKQEEHNTIETGRSSGEDIFNATCIDSPIHVDDPNIEQQCMTSPHLNDSLGHCMDDHSTPELAAVTPPVISPIADTPLPEVTTLEVPLPSIDSDDEEEESAEECDIVSDVETTF